MISKFNNKQFSFGDYVQILGYVDGNYNNEKHNYRGLVEYKMDIPIYGRICGISKIMSGTRYMGGEYEPITFIKDSVISIWEVKIAMRRKPLKCLSEQLKRTESKFTLPLGYGKRLSTVVK